MLFIAIVSYDFITQPRFVDISVIGNQWLRPITVFRYARFLTNTITCLLRTFTDRGLPIYVLSKCSQLYQKNCERVTSSGQVSRTSCNESVAGWPNHFLLPDRGLIIVCSISSTRRESFNNVMNRDSL